MNWGNKLIIVFILFACIIGTMVYKAINTKVELVSKDYYKDELRYQDRIDGRNNAEKIGKVAVTQDAESVAIALPAEMKGIAVTGEAWFYCQTDDVKDRIVEFLAVGALKGEVKGSIILLVGPPGVGKTSIGKSIAEALGRSFYRFSVGGMRDEAEIKGHRRTYIGAMPGKFVQALKSCQTANPVIMLDEIDKIGSSYQGDPASALLEVLDPEQNKDFLDHYLDVRFDLSKVLFVCTANTTDSIPDALLDRMEVIRLAGYITEEKMRIAKRHLWPALLKESGISPKTIEITPPAIHHIIEGYAREAGVRNLRKMMERIIRKTAVKLVTGEIETARIHVKDIEESLGHPKFSNEKPENVVGVTTGLAWTSMGGATLNIEASRIHTLNRGFKLSGQLGNVMQESANIAYSYVSSNLARYKGDPKFFDEAFVHLHVPDGATPKDGPSAGITMATALLSLARNEKLKEPVAMTGELSLTGHVLPVGGIREKIIAARRVGIKNIIIPFDNKHDFDEMPDYLKEGLTMHFAKHFEDVVKLTFMPRTKVSLSKRSTDGINQRRRLSRAKTTQRRTVTDTASA
ncbi:MAG: endopeptidase La [Thiotrichales bacterium 39-47-5]|nr:MAG: endopeptidase La [Thiotrichales bacterium 39-47-5]